MHVPLLVWEDHNNFYLAFGAPFAFGRGRFAQNLGQENTQQITQWLKRNWGQHRTDWSFSISTSQHPAHRILKFLFWNFFWFLHFFNLPWTKPCVINPWIRQTCRTADCVCKTFWLYKMVERQKLRLSLLSVPGSPHPPSQWCTGILQTAGGSTEPRKKMCLACLLNK
jgi:hypothetical protein